jgi:UDP-glucose 4-epimerase
MAGVGGVSVLVTGHRGFVGGHLCKRLGEVVGIDLKDGADILTADLPEVDRVYHLAANTDAQSPDVAADARVNIMGTLRLLERYGDRVVFASSSMVAYPVTPYGISKLAAEKYCRMYGAAVVRFCNLFGDGGHSVIDRFRAGCGTIRGDGNQLRTYAPVEDAVEALLSVKPGEVRVLAGADISVRIVAAMYPGDHPKETASPLDMADGRQVMAWV